MQEDFNYNRHITGSEFIDFILNNQILLDYWFRVEDGESNVRKEIVWYPFDANGNHYIWYEDIDEIRMIIYVDEIFEFWRQLSIYLKKTTSRWEHVCMNVEFTETVLRDEESDLYRENFIGYNLINLMMLSVDAEKEG